MVGRTQSELEKNAQGVVSEQSMAITAKEFLDQVRRRGSPCGLTGDFVAQLGKRFDSGLGRFYFQFLTPKDTSQMESLADTLRQGF